MEKDKKNLYHISFHFTCIFDKLWYLRMVEALCLHNTVCHGCKVLSLSELNLYCTTEYIFLLYLQIF